MTEAAGISLKTRIAEEDDASTTNGRYGVVSLPFDAPGPAGTVTLFDLPALPIPISMLSTCLDCKDVNNGDEIGFDVAPESPVGQNLSADVSATDTVITVPTGFTDLLDAGVINLGQHLVLDDGTNKEDLGSMLSYTATTVTVKRQAQNAYLAATPTALKITTSMSPALLSDGWIEVAQGNSKIAVFGEDKIGGSLIPAGKVIRIRYKNNTTTTARPRIDIAFLY